jgi:outer membrane protein assembly factor BamA
MKITVKLFSILTILLLISNQLIAQFAIQINHRNSIHDSLLFKNRIQQQEKLNSLILDYKNQGYYGLKVENDTTKSLSTIFLGEKINIKIDKVQFIDSIVSIQKSLYLYLENKVLNYNSLTKAINKIISYYENNGRPFAKIEAKPKINSDSAISINLVINSGPEILYDSLDIKGSSRINNRFMRTYLGIKKGKKYNETEIQSISKRLTALTFVKAIKNPEIAFIGKQTRLILYLNKQNSSQFDGIIGFLPSGGIDNKTLITGELKLNLKNTLNYAEQMEIYWRRPNPLSQDLLTNITTPYLLGTPYGVELKFKLLKKDTTTLTTTFNIGGNYYFSGMNYIKAYYEQTTSSLLSTVSITTAGSLASNIDYKVQRYGLSSYTSTLDDVFMPTRGIKLDLDVNIGNRKIVKNAKVPETLYQEIPEMEVQAKSTINIEAYFPIIKKLVLNISNKTHFISGNKVYENEMYRFGGLTTLRGFNEESISATFATIANTELRWFIDRRTYLYIFWNGAYYEQQSINNFIHDTPNGFGAGLSFDTPAGIFNITYALGKEFNNPIQFKYGKIHFGIVARF